MLEKFQAQTANSRFWFVQIVLLAIVGIVALFIQLSFGLQLIQTLPGVLQGNNLIFPPIIAISILVLTSAAQFAVWRGGINLKDGWNGKEIALAIVMIFLTISEVFISSNIPFVVDAYPSSTARG